MHDVSSNSVENCVFTGVFFFFFCRHRFHDCLAMVLSTKKPWSFLPTHPAPLYCPSLPHNLLGPTETHTHTQTQIYAVIGKLVQYISHKTQLDEPLDAY